MSYSYSGISLYEKCPKKYYYKYILKLTLPFEDKPVFEKGRFIHHIIEFYPTLPEFKFKFKEVENKKDEYLKQINTFIETNKKMKFLLSNETLLHREKVFYLDKNLKEVNTKEESLLNGIIDYIGQYQDNILIVDWKSGKSTKYASLNQLKYYSLYIFNNFPNINKLKILLFFVEQDKCMYEEVTRDDYNNIKEKYLNIITKIETDTEYKNTKCEDCIHCDYYLECKPFQIKLTKGN
jgi:ATP-dependent helicase/nuclease subunit B